MATEIDALPTSKSIGWTDALLTRLGANSIGLGARLSITAPANASALSSTGYSLTGSNASSMIDLAGTWNTSGNPVLIKAAIANTASGSTSKFLSFLAGASGTTEVFSVDKDGKVAFTASANKGWTIDGSANGTIQYQNSVGPNYSIQITGDTTGSGGAAKIKLGSTGVFEWSSAVSAQNGSTDLIVLRDAANTLALRNSTAAQALNIYNTYTSGSVYERGFMRWVSNVLEIGTEHVGGVLRAMHLKGQNIEARFSSGNQFIVRNDATEVARFTGGNQLQFLNGGNILFVEATAPSAPSANQGVLFLQDNGAGKSQLCVRFNTGAIQVLSTEP